MSVCCKRKVVSFAALATMLVMSTPARADQGPAATVDPDAAAESAAFPIRATRRQGFTFGGIGGLQLLSATGTPARFEERTAEHRTETGVTLVPLAGTLFVGGTFTDWLGLSIGGTASHFARGGLELTQLVVVFRLETWPLYPLGGLWRDLGVAGEFGTGMSQVTDARTGDELADGGGLSHLGAQVFWDATRVGGLAVGPLVGYARASNETFTQHVVWLGMRAAFYAGP